MRIILSTTVKRCLAIVVDKDVLLWQREFATYSTCFCYIAVLDKLCFFFMFLTRENMLQWCYNNTFFATRLYLFFVEPFFYYIVVEAKAE
jgi:hypothetical protein